jgi:regulatory protein
MNPHESSADTPRRKRRFPGPMDRDWLERIALRYAARWESSAAGVGTHLERKISERCEATGENPSAAGEFIPQVVERLVEGGYVNDQRFAATTIDRLRRQGRSAAQIESRLVAKGISESIRRELLQRRDDIDHDSRAAWQLASRRRLGPYCEDPEERKRNRNRHLAVFARQGFDREIAERVIDANTPKESC